jgi:hypothetical protein
MSRSVDDRATKRDDVCLHHGIVAVVSYGTRETAELDHPNADVGDALACSEWRRARDGDRRHIAGPQGHGDV